MNEWIKKIRNSFFSVFICSFDTLKIDSEPFQLKSIYAKIQNEFELIWNKINVCVCLCRLLISMKFIHFESFTQSFWVDKMVIFSDLYHFLYLYKLIVFELHFMCNIASSIARARTHWILLKMSFNDGFAWL